MTENAINADTVLIGLVGIRDDVRPEAREAIAEVQKAGIQVVMITGDRLETAVAIAREAGLLRTRDDVALTSTQLNELSDDEVKKIIPASGSSPAPCPRTSPGWCACARS